MNAHRYVTDQFQREQRPHFSTFQKALGYIPGVGLGLDLGEGEGAGLGVSGSGCGFGVSEDHAGGGRRSCFPKKEKRERGVFR